MLIKIIITFLCLFLVSFETVAKNRIELSLQTYLREVLQYNQGLQGANLLASGASQRMKEGTLLIKPRFFAEGQYLQDNYDPNWSPINGNSRNLQTYKAGISQTTPYGIQGKVYYNYQHQTLAALPPLLPSTTYTASSPIVELNIPLARNLVGRETRANVSLLRAQVDLAKHLQQFNNQQLMAQAESAYWHLAIARQIIAKQQESLHRAVQIQQWISIKATHYLKEEADILQAQSAVESKKLDIQSAMNDLKLAELNFNNYRGICSTLVNNILVSYHPHITDHVEIPAHGVRQDVFIAEQEQNMQIANARVGIEKNTPDLDLYMSYAFNGNNPSANQAIAQSFTTNYPSTAVGLRLSLPLDFNRLKQDRAGYKKEILGAKYLFKQKLIENDRLRESLILKIHNAQSRLSITTQLEKINSAKLNAERVRLTYGKTTTYQVLLFEQELVNAQIAQFMLEDEILQLRAQLRTFGATNESC